MFTLSSLIGLFAGVLTFFAYVPYFFSMLKGKTKPHRVTWWILVFVGLMLAGGYYSLGARNSIWVPIGYILGPLLIALFSFRFGEGGWSAFDRLCVEGVLIAAFFWWLFDATFIALIINLVMDWIGLMPTVLKSYHRPHTEDRLSWVCWFSGSFFNLFAVGHWTLELSFYPVYMVLGNGVITALVCWPGRHRASLERHLTSKIS